MNLFNDFACNRCRPVGSAMVTAAARLAGGARPPGIAKESATTESDIAASSDEAGPFWPKASGRDGVAATAAVKSFGEARPPGIAKHSATKERELAEGSDEVGPSWSKANSMNNAAAWVIEAPETASQDRRLQHTVELAFVHRIEVQKIALQERISEGMRGKISRVYLQRCFQCFSRSTHRHM